MDRLVYLNGRLVPAREAALSVMDYGFLYGYGLFETLRAYGGRPFRLQAHLDRLSAGVRELGIPVSVDGLASAVQETLQANELIEARVRISLSIGPGPMTPDASACHAPTVLVVTEPYSPPPESAYRRGFRATVSRWRRDSQSPLSRLKTANFLPGLLARREAKASGYDEALLLNEHGLLAEGSVCNVFLVKDGTLITPGVDSGVLPGITRQAVLELARSCGVPCEERDVPPDGLLAADEAFLTSSLIELMPLTQVDGEPIGSGAPGEVTRRITAAYRKLVASG